MPMEKTVDQKEFDFFGGVGLKTLKIKKKSPLTSYDTLSLLQTPFLLKNWDHYKNLNPFILKDKQTKAIYRYLMGTESYRVKVCLIDSYHIFNYTVSIVQSWKDTERTIS